MRALGPFTGAFLSRSRNIPSHVFRRLIQPPDHPHTELRRREQILTSLPRGI